MTCRNAQRCLRIETTMLDRTPTTHDEPGADSAPVQKPNDQASGLKAWTDRMREGMGRMATDEAERLKVARRLF